MTDAPRASRQCWWLLAVLAAGCAGGPGGRPAAPARGAVGCYVVLNVAQTSGPTTDFLFPGFFSLDTLPVPDAAIPGRQVLLPRDDLSRRAGAWSWTEQADSVTVNAVTASQGWRLGFTSGPADWRGQLHGWADSVAMSWSVGGRRVECPSGLVPAAS